MTIRNDSEKRWVYIGTYTEGPLHFPCDDISDSRGIYTALFDPATGDFENLECVAETPNPSFLTKHPSLPILYSVNECVLERFQEGGLSVFSIGEDGVSFGKPESFSALGLAPCHLMVHPHGRFLVVSNYRDGRFVLYFLDRNGMPHGDPVIFQSQGNGPHPKRQDGPHAHSAAIDPLTGNLLMVDLGTDTIFVRSFDEISKSFSTDSEYDLKVAPGSGCRHLVFSPDGGSLYVIGELGSTVSVFLRKGNGFFEGPQQRISTLPPDFEKHVETTAAAIVMHPTGKYVYASNRGTGLLSVFEVDERRRLAYKFCQTVKSKMPRFCTISSAQRFRRSSRYSTRSFISSSHRAVWFIFGRIWRRCCCRGTYKFAKTHEIPPCFTATKRAGE